MHGSEDQFIKLGIGLGKVLKGEGMLEGVTDLIVKVRPSIARIIFNYCIVMDLLGRSSSCAHGSEYGLVE